MFGFLLALLILDGILLMVVVLLQSGKGGGLAAVGGGMSSNDSLIGGRQAANLLTKTSWVTGGVFLALALVLSVMSARARQPESILRDTFREQGTQQTAPQPVVPGLQPTDEGAATPEATIPGTQPDGN